MISHLLHYDKIIESTIQVLLDVRFTFLKRSYSPLWKKILSQLYNTWDLQFCVGVNLYPSILNSSCRDGNHVGGFGMDHLISIPFYLFIFIFIMLKRKNQMGRGQYRVFSYPSHLALFFCFFCFLFFIFKL